ncbi:MAG: hypothetical protein IKB82_01975 [Clostridia bacterium]|nr:hypothetical protein [Clostridia bacterium]
MAAATQQAPGRAPGRAAGTPKQKEQTKKAGNMLAGLSQAAGIAIMAVLLVVSLFVGNFRALAGATPKDFIRQGDVKSIIEDRLDAATNAKTVALRAGLDEFFIDPVENAMHALEQAKTARDVSRADQDLTAAVSGIIAEAKGRLDGEGQSMLQVAADDFAEMGSFLRQEARSYNEKAEKAEALYDKLPTRFVLPEPDVYEGI